VERDILFFSAFAKLREATISVVMSVYQHKQHGSHLTDFHMIWHLRIFSKLCPENSSLIKIRQEKRVIYMKAFITFMVISRLILLRMRNVSYKKFT